MRPRASQPDLILLDLMLPDGSGFDVCRELRRDSSQVPIIMLTASGDEADRIVGPRARRRRLRRQAVQRPRGRGARPRRPAPHERGAAPATRGDGPLEVGDVRLDPAAAAVTLDGQPLELTRKEFDLLRLLMSEAGSVVTRERLIDEVWDVNWFGSTKTLDVHVSGAAAQARRRLGRAALPPHGARRRLPLRRAGRSRA